MQKNYGTNDQEINLVYLFDVNHDVNGRVFKVYLGVFVFIFRYGFMGHQVDLKVDEILFILIGDKHCYKLLFTIWFNGNYLENYFNFSVDVCNFVNQVFFHVLFYYVINNVNQDLFLWVCSRNNILCSRYFMYEDIQLVVILDFFRLIRLLVLIFNKNNKLSVFNEVNKTH